MQANPLEPLNKLGEKLAEEAAKLGLHMEHFLIAAMTDPPLLQCVFSIDPDQLGKDAEQESIDRQFEQMMREQKAAEREAEAEATALRMREHLKKLRLGGEDD